MKITMPVSNSILSAALLKYQIERIDNEYPTIEDCNKQFQPNKQTEEKINKLIGMEKKPYFVLINTMGKRVACIIVALFIATTTTVFSVKALREPFINFIVETYEKFSTIIFKNTESQSGESAVLTEYFAQTYIPDGYTKTYEEKLSLSYFCEYTNANNDVIAFEQKSIHNAQAGIDTENTTTEKIYINNKESIFYENKGQKHIVFNYNQYTFFISGNLEKSELIHVAESIEKNK